MQLTLPLFSSDVTLVSPNVGVYSADGIVCFLLNGLPIYSHKEGDVQAFRFFTSNLIDKGLCTKTEIKKAFHITIDQVNRACKIFQTEGESGFFKPENRHGHCHKLVGENLVLAQRLIDEGLSNVQIGKACNVRESAIRYSIKQGYLKKKFLEHNSPAIGSQPDSRSLEASLSPMGIATTNVQERSLASFGQIKGLIPTFGSHNSIAFGGVLLLLPALIAQGLMKIKETHQINEGYYSLQNIILTLAFMALCRIKNPQQLQLYKAGELGKLVGYDRIPEMKCLRTKMKELFANNTTTALNSMLAKNWINESEELMLYIDGHVKVYNGHQANLTKKFVSRQKLCLAGTTDFWLHDTQGMPMMMWTGELNEKLQYMIEFEIIPHLQQEGIIAKPTTGTIEPVCTLIFDREAYEPDFFARLWETHRIAIISYRKNVKDLWPETDFVEYAVPNIHGGKPATMLLCEKQVVLNGHKFREIRKLSESNHQTPIVCTHPSLGLHQIATKMFARWLQENYFKYMIADYSLDHLYQYGIEEIELSKKVVNPAHRSISNQHKKEKEKLGRLEKELLKNVKLSHENCIDTFRINVESKVKLVESIEQKRLIVSQLKAQKDSLPYKITIAELPEDKRYNTLKKESAYFMATLKMICYRAETAMANLLDGHYKREENERRSIIKEIIFTPADIKPDLENNQLIVSIHTMSTPQKNQIVHQICQELNKTETIFPGTNLQIIYKSIAH